MLSKIRIVSINFEFLHLAITFKRRANKIGPICMKVGIHDDLPTSGPVQIIDLNRSKGTLIEFYQYPPIIVALNIKFPKPSADRSHTPPYAAEPEQIIEFM